jgi:hypothetical protein
MTLDTLFRVISRHCKLKQQFTLLLKVARLIIASANRYFLFEAALVLLHDTLKLKSSGELQYVEERMKYLAIAERLLDSNSHPEKKFSMASTKIEIVESVQELLRISRPS